MKASGIVRSRSENQIRDLEESSLSELPSAWQTNGTEYDVTSFVKSSDLVTLTGYRDADRDADSDAVSLSVISVHEDVTKFLSTVANSALQFSSTLSMSTISAMSHVADASTVISVQQYYIYPYVHYGNHRNVPRPNAHNNAYQKPHYRHDSTGHQPDNIFLDTCGSSTIAIDNKIEQAMDLVKSHLMFAVREEVEVLKEQIKGLVEKISQLEYENGILRTAASQETLAKLAQPRPQPPSSSS